MSLEWKTSIKAVPWSKVLSAAPSIVEGAKKFWSSVASKDALIRKLSPPSEIKAYSPDPSISNVEKQMQALELRTAQLGEEIVLSSEIIDKLAEQQSQLVQAIDILRVRTHALLWVCAVLGLAVIVLIYLNGAR